MFMVWCIGLIIGFVIGGVFVCFCISYLEIFVKGIIWDWFFYLFFNFFSVVIVLIGVVVGFFFFEEIYVLKKGEWDWGWELGDYLLVKFGWFCGCWFSIRNLEK